jgi:serine protease Do
MPLASMACRLAGIVLFAALPGVHAANLPPQAAADAITRAMQAVVGLQVTAAEDARSADTLGMEREGSGVVIGPDGLILTIGYLIIEADTIEVTTSDNRVVPARAIGYDQATGFGLVRPVLPLRDIEPVALGTARGLPERTSLLAATGGDDGSAELIELVSTRPFSAYWEYHIDGALFAAPPLRNHSGAPLFNASGELVGIGSVFVGNARGGRRELPGTMFVPVDLLKPILGEMQQTGTTRIGRRPWLGVTSAEQGGRIRIVRVNQDSPADEAGLVPGDFVLAVDGEKVGTLEAFYKKLWARPEPESAVQLTVLHGTELLELTVHAVDRLKTMRKPAGI